MVDRDRRSGLLGGCRAGLGEIQEPVLPRLLKRPPDRIEPVYQVGQQLALLLLEPGRTMLAIADAWPEGHVEEHPVDIVRSANLGDAGQHVVAIG